MLCLVCPSSQFSKLDSHAGGREEFEANLLAKGWELKFTWCSKCMSYHEIELLRINCISQIGSPGLFQKYIPGGKLHSRRFQTLPRVLGVVGIPVSPTLFQSVEKQEKLTKFVQ